MSIGNFKFDKRRNQIFLVLIALLLGAMAACDPGDQNDGFEPTMEMGKGDSAWWDITYDTSYKNLVLAAKTIDGKDIAFVAGTHAEDFPYSGTEPWDNGLLKVGERYFHFTQKNPSSNPPLMLQLDIIRKESKGNISYQGEMVEKDGNQVVSVNLNIPVALNRFQTFGVGKYLTLGMSLTPFSITGDSAAMNDSNEYSIVITRDEQAEHQVIQLETVQGALESSALQNLKGWDLATTYDYLSVAKANNDNIKGYSYVTFKAEFVFTENNQVKKMLECFEQGDPKNNTSKSFTIWKDAISYEYQYEAANPNQVKTDVTILHEAPEFELINPIGSVLSPRKISLKRKLVETTDATGVKLYGLQEEFIVKQLLPKSK
jgi:hypothetical protein